MALELKAADRWLEKDFAGLNAFLKATPHCKAAILCHNGEEAVKLGERLWVLPISLILSGYKTKGNALSSPQVVSPVFASCKISSSGMAVILLSRAYF